LEAASDQHWASLPGSGIRCRQEGGEAGCRIEKTNEPKNHLIGAHGTVLTGIHESLWDPASRCHQGVDALRQTEIWWYQKRKRSDSADTTWDVDYASSPEASAFDPRLATRAPDQPGGGNYT
jgi:hypothetical protein